MQNNSQPGDDPRCAQAYKEISGNITKALHDSPVWEGCNSITCQMHLALLLNNKIASLAHYGITSEGEGLPMMEPILRIGRFCSEEDTTKQMNDAKQVTLYSLSPAL